MLEDFRQAQGRSDGAVTELGDVVAVLARGQVREVLLADEYGEDELDDRHVWVGPEPLQVALTKEELFELGVTDGAHELPATVALVRAALGQDAGLTFVAAERLDLVDGVGALCGGRTSRRRASRRRACRATASVCARSSDGSSDLAAGAGLARPGAGARDPMAQPLRRASGSPSSACTTTIPPWTDVSPWPSVASTRSSVPVTRPALRMSASAWRTAVEQRRRGRRG